MKVGILVPTLTTADAVSHDAIGMADVLREQGYDVDLFALRNTSAEAARPVHELASALPSPHDALIYHHQIGFEAGVRAIEALRCRKVVKYHNVTPPEFYAGIDEGMAQACAAGLAQVARLAESDAIIWADSEVNAADFRLINPWREVHILPPFHQAGELLDTPPETRAVAGLDDWTVNLLAVGRVAPNKNLAMAVETLAEYRKGFEPHARLIIAGDASAGPAKSAVEDAIREHRQEGHVLFTGKISRGELRALYQAADILLVTSRHEGFCVPLVEAMALRVPIVATSTPAVAETAAEAATFGSCATELAQHVDTIVNDRGHREKMLSLGRQRYVAHFARDVIKDRFVGLFKMLDSTKLLMQAR